MKVLVTGGAGFIGSHIADAFLADGAEVTIFDNFSSGKTANVTDGIRVIEGDVRDPEAVERAFADVHPEAVSHQAAQISVGRSFEEPALDAEINVYGGVNVLEACRRHEVDMLTFASTAAVYGEVDAEPGANETATPKIGSPYAASKFAFEQYLDMYRRVYGLRSAVTRYSNVYGPRQDPHGEAGVMAIFCRAVRDKGSLQVFGREVPGDGGGLRDYIFVKDVAAAVVHATQTKLDGLYNASTATMHSTADIVAALGARELGLEITDKPPREGDIASSCLDSAKLQATGWAPAVAFADGVRQTLDWYLAGGDD